MKINDLIIKSSAAPTVECDWPSRAAYIRFGKAKVSRTVSPEQPGAVVAIDLDAKGDVVGVELIGVKELSIHCFVKLIPMNTRSVNWDRARFIPAGCLDDLQPA